MIFCSKLKNCLCKIVIKSKVVTEFNVTKSRLHCNRHLIVSLFFGWIEPSIINHFSFRAGNCNVGTKLMAIWDMKIFWSDTFDHQLTYCVKLSIAKSFQFVNSLLLSFKSQIPRKVFLERDRAPLSHIFWTCKTTETYLLSESMKATNARVRSRFESTYVVYVAHIYKTSQEISKWIYEVVTLSKIRTK